MKKNAYPFGGTFNKFFIDDPDNWRPENWPELFNYAVPDNQMKWRSHEWDHDQLDFEYSDAMRDLFEVLLGYQIRIKIIILYIYFYK